MPTLNLQVAVTISVEELTRVLALLDVQPAPAPKFDETTYLMKYPDVAAAVRTGFFKNGYDHYIKHGRAEGRTDKIDAPQPAPVPVPVPLPDPKPTPVTPGPWEPAAVYPNHYALINDLHEHPEFNQRVSVDDEELVGGFGPPLLYYAWPDGKLRLRQKPPGGGGEVINLG